MADTEIEKTKKVPAQAEDTKEIGVARVKTFSSLSNPVFRLYFIAMLCQTAAFNMNQVTSPLLVYRITGSAALLGVVSVAGSVPHIFFALFGGAIADRMHKKHILFACLAAFAAVALNLAVLLTFGVLKPATWWILVINTIVQSSLMGLMIPARHAIIREIVSGDLLMNAVALNMMGGSSFLLLAPAVAGFVIDGFGFNAVYFIIAGFYALGVALITLMPLTGTISGVHRDPVHEIVEGFRYIFSNRNILFVLGFFLLTVPLAWPFRQLVAIFADSVFHVGGKGMGILMSISGAGAIVGSLIIASLPGKRRGLLMLCGSLALGLVLTAFSFSNVWVFSMILMVFVGLAQTMQMSLSNTLVQHYTPNEYRGRVMGVYDMQMSFVGPMTLIAGVLTQRFGVQTAFGAFSIILTAVALLTLLFVPRLRNMN